MVTFKDIRNNKHFELMISKASNYLKSKGYTEHGMRHMTYVSKTTASILEKLGHSARTVELGAIAGYLHDIGNMHNRVNHGVTGANILFYELKDLGMDLDEITEITIAVANHDVDTGRAVNPLSAALILADKSDAHRTRVHRKKPGPLDIHDRVNLAIESSDLITDKKSKTITLNIDFDQTKCQLMDFFEIYLKRMEMCKQAADLLDCRFRLVINGLELLGHIETVDYEKAGA